MRFLMKNHRGTPNNALDSCVPAKTFWMRSGPAAVFAPSAKPRLGHLGNCRSANRAHRPFRKSSILLLKAVAAAIRALQISPRPVSTGSLTVLFPYMSPPGVGFVQQ